LQRNSIAWEERLIDTTADVVDDFDDDDLSTSVSDAAQSSIAAPHSEPLYAETPSNLLLELDKWLSSPTVTSSAPMHAARDRSASSAAPAVASDAADKRLLNGFVVARCSLFGVGGDPIVIQFPATASGKQVKAELIDSCAALMAFQPRDLVLEIDAIAPVSADSASTGAAAIVVSDFDRFVQVSGAVFEAYIRNDTIACTVRVPQVDDSDLIGDLSAVVDSLVLPSPQPSPRTAAVTEAVATPVTPAPSDDLEAIARTKQLPALPPPKRNNSVAATAAAAVVAEPQAATPTLADFNANDDSIDVVERTHTFELRFVGRPVECHHCNTAVWGGMASEIYVCSACSFSCHKACVSKVEQSCSRLARLSAVIVQLKPTVTTAAEAADVGGSVVRQPRLRTDTLSSGSVRQRTGWLVKQGGGYKSWKRRWCVVRRGELLYHKDRKATEPLNTVNFVGATLHWPKDEAEAVVDGRKHCFSVETAQRRWYFQTASAADLRDWLDAVHAHIQHANRRAAESSAAAVASSIATSGSNGSGAIFDVGHGTIGTDAGSEIYQWDLDNLSERRVPLIRWPAGAAYTARACDIRAPCLALCAS
jgi:hypothetical protein